MLCRIGAVEIWRILEVNAPFLTPEELWPEAGPDARATVEAHVPGCLCPASGLLILPIQAFLLKTPAHVVLVDACICNDKTVPGLPDWNGRSDGRFMAGLAAAGVGPGDVDFVLCTHLHTDHVGWNTRLLDGRWVPTFPRARYLMPAADEGLQRARGSDLWRESVSPIIEAGLAELAGADHMLGDEVSLVPTPGHTPGHVSVLVRSEGRTAMITGDALHSAVQCWRPDWRFRYDVDAGRAVASRRNFLEQASETGCTVLGSHFMLPSIGRVAAKGEAFRWIEWPPARAGQPDSA